MTISKVIRAGEGLYINIPATVLKEKSLKKGDYVKYEITEVMRA